MQFWSEMDTKYGFSDGEAIPPGIETYREVYLRAMNALLKRFDSNIRVVAYDRGGCHNWCLFLRVNKDAYAKMMKANPASVLDGSGISITSSEVTTEPKPDEAYQKALGAAYELDLDDYVEVKVTVDRKSLEAALTQVAA